MATPMQKLTPLFKPFIKNSGFSLQSALLATVLSPLIIAVSINIYQNYSPKLAPDVTFSTLTGEKIALKALHGKPVLVTFWASDCPECLKEIPIFTELYENYHSKGLEIIAVAMPYDPPNHVIALNQEKHIPYPIALDLDTEVVHAFDNVQVTPTTFLINPQGIIDLKIIGKIDFNALKTHIETYIKG